MGSLYDYGARYYDLGTGRFLPCDPNSGSTADRPSLHRYTYAANYPTTLADPSGEGPLDTVLRGVW